MHQDEYKRSRHPTSGDEIKSNALQPENCTPKTRSAFRVNFIVVPKIRGMTASKVLEV
jgi:hypothetical protein